MLKWALILSYILNNVFEIYVDHLNKAYSKKELPDNVKDVYDKKEYQKYQSYSSENAKISLIERSISMIIICAFLIKDFYAKIFSLFPDMNICFQYFIGISILTVLSTIIETPFSFYSTFVIEEKYGMNKTTKKTFVSDLIKELILSILLELILTLLILFLFEKFGNMAILWTIIVMIGISLVISFLAIPFMRLFNKFTPLEEGELKDKLMHLCDKYKVQVKKIVIRDASRRTTKANAFCTGMGKKKTISLDDNLVNEFDVDQIVAVFAHEFGHARYKHVLKSLPFGIFQMSISVVMMGIVLNVPALFHAFGFTSTNYYFVQLLATMISWPISVLLDAVSNYLSRKHEYEADAFATREGYGDALIASLKKLTKESLSEINPHPLVIQLEYTHPTLSQRIDAIEKNKKSM